MSEKVTTAVYIFRRDLRIEDNTAFLDCLEKYDTIYPIFVFTPEQIKKNDYRSEKAIQFMIESLLDLSDSLNITTYFGDVLNILSKIKRKIGVFDVYANRDYSPYSVYRDTTILKWCIKNDHGLYMADDVLLNDLKEGIFKVENEKQLQWDESQKAYQKFTPYYNLVMKHLKNIREPRIDTHTMELIKTKIGRKILMTETIKLADAYFKFCEPNENIIVHGGRKVGFPLFRKRVISGEFSDYAKKHNELTYNTTVLSPYLKFGCLSVREVYAIIKSKHGVHHDIIRQLVWRDFYHRLMFAFPHVLKGQITGKNEALKSKYDNIKWENNKRWLEAWKYGNTGFPIVDACMRQMLTTGYMHNRGRLIVSSFLVKIMGIDWREGEKWFACQLVDYDPANNNGNWQWTAGTGADSQPYFRIFNPWTQSDKHDKNAEYIKKWIPELKDVEPKHIHSWFKYGDESVYITPILNYTEQRNIILKMYKDGL
jgi:deoxyribodipyrimidine photo-lyase